MALGFGADGVSYKIHVIPTISRMVESQRNVEDLAACLYLSHFMSFIESLVAARSTSDELK